MTELVIGQNLKGETLRRPNKVICDVDGYTMDLGACLSEHICHLSLAQMTKKAGTSSGNLFRISSPFIFQCYHHCHWEYILYVFLILM